MKISKTLLIPIFLMIGSCCCTIFEEEIAYLNNVAEVNSFIRLTEFVKNSSRNIKNCSDFLSTLPGKILEKSTYEPDFFFLILKEGCLPKICNNFNVKNYPNLSKKIFR